MRRFLNNLEGLAIPEIQNGPKKCPDLSRNGFHVSALASSASRSMERTTLVLPFGRTVDPAGRASARILGEESACAQSDRSAPTLWAIGYLPDRIGARSCARARALDILVPG